MTEASNAEFTTEELLSQARGNATAFILTTIAYLKEHGLDADDFVAYFGRQFAPGWDDLRAEPVAAVARTAALNAVSVGGTLGSLSGDETRAEVIMTGWPEGEEASSVLGLGPNDSDAMWHRLELFDSLISWFNEMKTHRPRTPPRLRRATARGCCRGCADRA